MKNKQSLRVHLSWYMTLTLLMMTFLSGGGIYYGIMHEAKEIFGASLVQTARILEGVMTRDLVESSQDHLMESLAATDLDTTAIEELSEYEKKLFFAVIAPDGHVLLKSLSAPDLPASRFPTGFFEFYSQDRNWYAFSLDSRHDDLRIIVGEQKDLRNELSESILGGLLWPLIIMLPLILLLLLYLIKIALTPLRKVGDEVRKQDFHNLKPINAGGVPNEIAPLVNSLNDMIENLGRAYQRERRFVSDASHELRNPLAALLINVENALEENRDEELSESLRAMHRSIQRLIHLVAQLLHLSHSENPLEQLNFEPVDIARVCQQVIDRKQENLAQHRQTLSFEHALDGCKIRGSEPLLNSLITNLIENAIRYSGEGSQIRVSCQQNQQSIQLRVEDSGPGINPDLRNKIESRFFRGDASDTRGAGLGLSIVRAISEAHDAQLNLEKSELGGLQINIRFRVE